MRGRFSGLPVVAAILFAALLFSAAKAHPLKPAPIGVARDCDRACLYKFVDQYMAALSAKDPARLPWAAQARFTENNVELPLGWGLWGTISALGAEDLRAADPETGQVAYYGVIDERGTKSFFALRMKVDDGKISEVETIVDRKGYGPGPFGNPETLQPVPVIAEDVPVDRRRPRERLIALADGYFNTLQLNDGQLFTQFTPDCSRRENGVWTANDPRPGSVQDPLSNTKLSQAPPPPPTHTHTKSHFGWCKTERPRPGRISIGFCPVKCLARNSAHQINTYPSPPRKRL